MPKSEIIDKIRTCDATESLTKEQKLASCLRTLDWDVLHSAFYKDTELNKYREIDVLASQAWTKGKKMGDTVVRIEMLVESKSADGYHLIFSPIQRYVLSAIYQRIWIGYEEGFHSKLFQIFKEKGLKFDQINRLNIAFKNISFPNEVAILANVMIDPPPASHLASAYRETNIGNTKNLDNSVLWRASQALYSAFRSLKQGLLDFHTEGIISSLEDKTLPHSNIEKDILTWFDYHIHMLDIFHPVVVTDSMLWLKDELSVKQIEWCRFVQLSPNSIVTFWFDVVRHPYFDNYAKEVSSYYRKSFSKHRLRILRLQL